MKGVMTNDIHAKCSVQTVHVAHGLCSAKGQQRGALDLSGVYFRSQDH